MKYFYNTIAINANGLYKDKGSKFIAYAQKVSNEDEAKLFIEKLKREHHAARHHCYAWVIGNNFENIRSSDDGEPSNTAGKPILNQIETQNLTDVIVVVVRYFGGIKLGVSGLIQAYREATSDALLNACKETKDITSTYHLEFTYNSMNMVMSTIKKYDIEVLERKFEDDCSLKIAVKLSNDEVFKDELQEFIV